MRKMMICFMAVMTGISLIGCNGTNSTAPENETEVTEVTTFAETSVSGAAATLETTENTSTFQEVDVSVTGWKMTIDDVVISPEISSEDDVQGKSSASSSSFVQRAEEGNTYVLIKMTIMNDHSTEGIDWKLMFLKDAEGTIYHRIDDSFIDSLRWTRMPEEDISTGTSEGWFAYEIPQEKAESGLVLSYEFENQTMKYRIN